MGELFEMLLFAAPVLFILAGILIIAAALTSRSIRRAKPNLPLSRVALWSSVPLPVLCGLAALHDYSVPIGIDENPIGPILLWLAGAFSVILGLPLGYLVARWVAVRS
jgi:hypothetical protein